MRLCIERSLVLTCLLALAHPLGSDAQSGPASGAARAPGASTLQRPALGFRR